MHQKYAADMSWMLRDLVQSIREIRFALVASSDGKALAAFGAEDPADIDRFAAVVAGLQALATPVAQQFPTYHGQLRLAMIEVDGGHLFVSRAGVETYLGVIAREGLDQGLLGHQMRDLSRRMGERLGTTPRVDYTTTSPCTPFP
jgi:predicted regulator of Ras-like GTPase activity (Roadblock/LC7/MglB family)